MAVNDALCATCELHAEAVFRVEGMDCNEEVVILERRLKPLAGLEAVSADLLGQRLHVKYDAAKLTTAAIIDAAGQTGMRIWLAHEAPAIGGADIEWRWRLMLGCAAALGAGLVLTTVGQAVSSTACFSSRPWPVASSRPGARWLPSVRARSISTP